MSSHGEFAHLKLPLEEIAKATNNFAEEKLIGQGGFGKVYKGNLLLSGKPTNIAARRLHYDYGQGDLEFWNEITMLSSLNHDNLVSFIGFCNEKGEKIIINEYEFNQSLDRYLSSPALTWMQRLHICVGVARALNYIHCDDGHESSVIHRNIKSSKILLNEKWKPKLSGFEHSKTNTKARRHRLVLADIIGTIGYVDPTYEKTGFVTHKSDVYSFGVVLFEVLCKRRAFFQDQREQHSPQFTEQNYKDKKLDVMEKLDQIADPHLQTDGKLKEPMPSTRRGFDLREPPIVQMPSFHGAFKHPNPLNVEGELDVMQKVDQIADRHLHTERKLKEPMPSVRSEFELQEPPVIQIPSFHPVFNCPKPPIIDGQPSSFVDGEPSSFGSGNPSSFSGGEPTSFDMVSTLVRELPSERPSLVGPTGLIDLSGLIEKALDLYGRSGGLINMSKWFDNEPPSGHLSHNAEQGIISPPLTLDPKHTDEPAPPANVAILPGKSYSMKEHCFILQPLFTMKRLDQYLHMPNEEILAQLAKSHYEEENLDDIIDPALREQMDPESLKIFSETAYNCLKDKRAQRPNIDQILRNLEKALRLQMRRENPGLVTGEVERMASNRWKGGALEHLKIPLIDIEVATKKFTERYLGSGTYGKVYRAELELPVEEKSKGKISKKWRTVAIKCIREDKHGKEGFNAEIELLTSCKHANIVSLLGFCDEGPNMILVYEHASNRSLDNYLGGTDSSTNLTWVQRLKIGIDIARGLNSLHTRIEDEQRIIHRDIKSGNILLGKNWVAKIADFGLSRFHHANQRESLYTENVAGTKEYLCPEYMKTGRLKRAIDIYSFGVVLFEILFGKLANDPVYVSEDENGIAYVARRHFEERTIHEMVDPKIMEEVDELTSTLHKGPNQDSLKVYLEIAYRCVAITQNDRPIAKDVLEELEKALSSQENNKDNLQMSFEEIKLATQNFSCENLIGGGGFGKVFKGEITHGNKSTTIIAKLLDRSQGQGEHHFLMELEILFEYKHENIIGLVGYCNENDEKIIVYEHASNRSLDRYLNDVSLTWTKRLNICIDIVRGLAFLHGGASTKEMVIHRDIKSANILLNGDWKAKISDFGSSAITAINQEVISKLVGTISYVDPQYEYTGFFTEKSDIYSLGVVLFEILYGRLLVPDTKDYDQQHVTRILKQILEEEKLGSIVFEGIKEQIDPESLSTFRVIVSECLYNDRKERPTAEHVLQQLEKSLEFQEDYEIWGPKLPEDYEEILKLSKSPGISHSRAKKKNLYNLFSEGILLQDGKVWFWLGSNGERNEMISARRFSYRNRSLHKWSVVSESRFKKVAEILDISNLMIKIKTRTHFLSPDTVYGVHLVFKFCDFKGVSKNPMYVDLKYRKGRKTLHAYFAKWRDDEWMMIELYRFLNQKEDVVFTFQLESLSPYYCREHDAIYVEGIEFQAIEKVGHNGTEKSREIQQVMKSNSNVNLDLRFSTKNEEILEKSKNYDEVEKLFSLSEVDGKKHLMLLAKASLYNISETKLFNSKPSADSRFQEVIELLPQLIFHISCTIKSQMLSRDTEYVCYLVFKLSNKCNGLHCPVEVRDLLQKSKVAEIVYFRSPSAWNVHDFTRVPKQRKDGWMEVNVGKLNSKHELQNDSVLVNLKLLSYQDNMSGLIICGVECRPT
ncbi:putative protein kinase RLK-Pelle-DLSV family [Helianthus debilis subsp. tardiflorus]